MDEETGKIELAAVGGLFWDVRANDLIAQVEGPLLNPREMNNSSKAAVLQMARSIANEFGKYKIRANSVLPGAVFGGSKMWTPELRAARAKIHGFAPDQLEEEYKKNNALGVIIDPTEIAEVVVFLASDKSAKMTGAALVIDGGGLGGYVR